MTNNILVRIVEGQNDFYDDLSRFSPSSIPGAYDDRDNLLPQIVPALMHYRDAESKEKIALIQAVARKYEVDGAVSINDRSERGMTDRTKIEVDGDVRMNDRTETGLTDRTRIQVNGAVSMNETSEHQHTKRTGIVQSGLTDRTMIQTDGAVRMNDRNEEGLTERTRLEQDERSFEAIIHAKIMVLKYQSEVAKVRAIESGKIHASNNELEAAKYQADAYKYAMITTEHIRSQARLGVSKDKLAGLIAKAQAEVHKMQIKAEYQRGTLQDRNRANVIEKYLQNKTRLIIAGMRVQVEYQLAVNAIEGKKMEEETKRQQSYDRTLRAINKEASRVIQCGLARGHDNPSYTIETDFRKISVKYDPGRKTDDDNHKLNG